MPFSTTRALTQVAIAVLLAAVAFGQTTARPAEPAAASGPRGAERLPAEAPGAKAGGEGAATITHVLNRLGYGPRPGDIEKVREIGVMNYTEQQLHPERIDDGALEARLDTLKTLDMSSSALAREYFLPAQRAKREQQKAQAQTELRTPGQERSGAGQAGSPTRAPRAAAARGTRTRQPRWGARRGPASDAMLPGGRGPRIKDVPRMQMSPAMLKQREVISELSSQKILRAAYSERQLQEVLTDFWFNHFNIFFGKGAARIMTTAYERDAIRPYVLGDFRTLLGATAHSPAMLFYLDNWMSTDPNGPHLSSQRRQSNRGRRFGVMKPDLAEPMRQPNRPTGLNENYARELMELHTLGVDGGYTQKDVIEVARAFTGWTIDRPRQGGEFRFDPRMHDPGEKRVLGHTINAGGEKDGEQVLDILARHRSTARFISTKLARRFVSDEPPQALVDRAAKRFLDADGDLREVVRTIIQSPEFFSPKAHGAKVKTPFEFVVSALRAGSAQVQSGLGLARALQQLGMPLYMAQPPTGYADTADAWVNTGGLVNRMNFAVSLVEQRVPGVRFDPSRTPLTALALGSPEFQRK